MAGTPSRVPGIFTNTLGRSTAVNRRWASAADASVSRARCGETSMLTKPSSPPVARYTGASTSQAARTSSITSRSRISAALSPCRPSVWIASSYSLPPPMDFSKIAGLVVTPPRPSRSTIFLRPPRWMSARLM